MTPSEFREIFANLSVFAKLDRNHKVVPARKDQMKEWYKLMEHRLVARDRVGPFLIGTIFLCINHSHDTKHPKWFETSIFDQSYGDLNNYLEDLFCIRYPAWEEAMAEHQQIVRAVKTHGAGNL